MGSSPVVDLASLTVADPIVHRKAVVLKYGIMTRKCYEAHLAKVLTPTMIHHEAG